MSKLPFISVIVLNYNGKDITQKCVNSVLKTDYPKYEIVIVDNGSTDKSYEFFKKIYKENPKIKIFRSDYNLQFTGGFNFGANYAKGEKIVLLSNDIEVDKMWLKELAVLAGESPRYIIQPKIMTFQNKKIIDNVGGKYNIFGFGFGIGTGEIDKGQYDKNSELDFASATTLMVDKRFFDKIGKYDEKFKSHYEDVDLALRAKKQGGKCYLCYKSIIYHKGSVTIKRFIKNNNLIFTVRRNRLKTIIKNYNGAEKYVRITALLSVYLLLIIQDILSFKKERISLTIRSIYNAFVSFNYSS